SIMGTSNSTITIDVVGNETEQLLQASGEVIDQVKGIDGVEKVTSNQQELKSVYDIVIDQEKANTAEVARQVQLLLNPFPIGTIKLDGKDTMVLLDSSIHPTSEAELKDISVAVNQEILPLSTIATIEKTN